MDTFYKFSKKSLTVLLVFAMILSSIIAGITVTAGAQEVTLKIWKGDVATGFAGGSGTKADPYEISNGAELAYLMTLIGSESGYNRTQTSGKYYELTADIYLNDISDPNWQENNPNSWYSFDKRFGGFFNGNGHTVYGIYYNGEGSGYGGLFPIVDAWDHSIIIENVTVSAAYINGSIVGGITGRVYGNTNTTTIPSFINCHVTSDVTIDGSNYAGGISGFIQDNNKTYYHLINCSSDATVNKNNKYFGYNTSRIVQYNGYEAATAFAGGKGTIDDPFEIATKEQLFRMILDTKTTGYYFELVADIDLNDTAVEDWKATATNWLRPYTTFNGTFDGNGYTINGLYYNGNATNIAFIKETGANAIVKNVIFTNASINTTSTTGAAIVTGSGGGTFSKIYIDETCEVIAPNAKGVAGIAAYGSADVTIDNSAVLANLVGSARVGAFTGDYWDGTMTITNCYATTELPLSGYRAITNPQANYGIVEDSNGTNVLTAEQMYGAAAMNNMPLFNWGVDWFTTNGYPTPYKCDHVYDNACDPSCNICDTLREVDSHVYDDDNDAYCNTCGFYRFELFGTTGDCQWEIENGVLRIFGNGAMGNFEIKDMPKSDWALYGITSVVIEEGVTSIGNAAFAGCNRLTSVSIPSTVKAIGYYPFINCESLQKFTVASGNTVYKVQNNCLVETANKKIIAGCKTSSIANGIKSIGDYAFFGSAITSINIPYSVTSIGVWAFAYCNSLEKISASIINSKYKAQNNCLIEKATNSVVVGCNNSTIPTSAASIGNYAFYGLNGTTSIDIPKNIKTIGTGAFMDCANIENVTLNDGLTKIGAEAFENCEKLTTINIPSTVSHISYAAFKKCTSIESIALSEGVTLLSERAFENCTALKEITVPATLLKIESNAFDGCNALKEVYYAGDKATYNNINFMQHNSVVLSAKWHFANCDHVYKSTTTNATCTINGKIVYTCTECGDTYEEPIKSQGHTAGDWEVVTEATTGADGLKIKKCSVCNETVEEKVIPRVLKIKGRTLALQSNISIIFRVDPIYFTKHGYSNPVVVFNFNGNEYRVSEYTVNADGVYEYVFAEAAPHQMKDIVTAVLEAEYEGEVYTSAAMEYSIYTYCYNQINKYYTNTSAKKLMALLVDILNYGAAAQDVLGYKLDNLANAELTEAQKALGYQGAIEYKDEKNLSLNPVENGIADFKSVGLALQDAVTVNFKFALADGATTDGLKAVVTAAGQTWEIEAKDFGYEVGNKGPRYVIVFEELNPAQMRDVITVQIVKDGEVVSDTATYSIESYGLSTAAQGNAKLAALVEAMARYGRSAAATVA